MRLEHFALQLAYNSGDTDLSQEWQFEQAPEAAFVFYHSLVCQGFIKDLGLIPDPTENNLSRYILLQTFPRGSETRCGGAGFNFILAWGCVGSSKFYAPQTKEAAIARHKMTGFAQKMQSSSAGFEHAAESRSTDSEGLKGLNLEISRGL